MNGESLGPFRLLEKLGEGGMGEVWRAADSRLGRDVALKLLPAAVASDPERLSRFEREARTLAALSHPRVAGIHEVGADGDRHYLIMELIEGEDLAQKLARGPLPLEEALELALQIVDGLAAAHARGIVHRDLKPANLMVAADGGIKILDFGLAKALDRSTDGASIALSHSPTAAATMTQPGVLLGTAAYMSPEQARGRGVDQQADIWAFGCVLFEMLTGRRAHGGETVTDILASVVAREPAWDQLPAATPRPIRRLLRRCLEKDPARRLHDIADARLDLEEGAVAEPAREVAAGGGGAPRPARLPWIVVGVLGLTCVALLAAWWSERERVGPRVRASILAPEGAVWSLDPTSPGLPAVSPDGLAIVFGASARGDDAPFLWLRRLDEPTARRLDGSAGAGYPFWSPESRRIGFFAAGEIRVMDADGGPTTTLCEAENGKGATWSEEGVVLFAPDSRGGLWRVSDLGGDPEPVTELDGDRREVSHRHPRFLPDGRRFLYLARTAPGGEMVGRWMVGDLRGGPPRELGPGATNVELAAGHLLFGREGTLMAQAFDVGAGELVGRPFPIVDQVLELPAAGLAVASVARHGVLAFHESPADPIGSELVWSSSGGEEADRLVSDHAVQGVRLDPTGRFVALTVADPESGRPAIWVRDLERDVRERLTFEEGAQRWPLWSADGSTIAYLDYGDALTIRLQEVHGATAPRVVATFEGSITDTLLSGWTPDGEALFLTLGEQDESGEKDWDVLEVPIDGGEPRPLLASDHPEALAVVSPDGRWLAFDASISERPEIYLSTYPDVGRRWKVSSDGGLYPIWSPDGGGLYFSDFSGQVFRVAVEVAGGDVRLGPATPILRVAPGLQMQLYDVAPDGRILSVVPPAPQETRPMSLVLNWDRDLPGR